MVKEEATFNGEVEVKNIPTFLATKPLAKVLTKKQNGSEKLPNLQVLMSNT